ncbi:hypothetical protein GIB67_041324 [Kingdonia uniflora]|uniref:UBZ3-type domain-containing protein n=1 Tax=Kingdonia uniflora TaxID=39325 RepID=A0A7J7NIM3_9MAGN|nr:hypothetical protein GIB67_041324 [Kingdonia uniflora]
MFPVFFSSSPSERELKSCCFPASYIESLDEGPKHLEETRILSANPKEHSLWFDDYKCSLCGAELPPSFVEERQEHSDYHFAQLLQKEESKQNCRYLMQGVRSMGFMIIEWVCNLFNGCFGVEKDDGYDNEVIPLVSPPNEEVDEDTEMEDLVEPDWSKVIGDESTPKAANERTMGVCFVTPPDCAIDSLFVEAPYEGQTFNTVDDACSYYEQYKGKQGFSRKKRNSIKRPRSDEIRIVQFSCLSNGLSKKNKTINPDRSEQDGKKCSFYQCRCKATFNINWKEKLGKFVVTSFSDVHNHKLVSPHNHHRMKINRFFSEATKNLTETLSFTTFQ